ncbi:nitrile hydratase subunit alpha [Ruegeria jejuensis]|uniref:nitrile hydratase subunit alpha n=1 Tax=Ruegeria jejuensis TaxID=3233338 RepID=UPI00355C68E2
MNNTEAQKNKNGMELLNKLQADPGFVGFCESNPKEALQEFGIDVPNGVELKVVKDTDDVKYLHIPQAPAEGEIGDSDLMNAQGGTTMGCFSAVVSIYYTVVSIVGGTGTFD